MNLYPRSFLRLLLLGNVLAVLPLLLAIGYASLTVDDMARRSELAISQASQVAMVGRALSEDFNHMERTLRQYEALHDASLLDAYNAERREWQAGLATYATMPLLGDLAGKIRGLGESEAAAYGRLGKTQDGVPKLEATLVTIKKTLQALLEEARLRVEREQDAFRVAGKTHQQRLMAALLSALALTVLMVYFGRQMVGRLWRNFEGSVLALGVGQLDTPICLQGPYDMQRVGRRLDWLRKRLFSLENERARVMRHVSHELKTPLAALREGASLLQEGVAGPMTERQTKIAGIIHGNVVRLQGLIDGLLNLQQASHAREAMERTPVRLDQVMEMTLNTHQLAAHDRRIHIVGSLEALTVEGSYEALVTLANNLVSNAIKFSPDGGRVRINLTRSGEYAVLDVMDSGPGISPQERERIFEPFFRGALAKGIAGAGLGLAIAREFVLAQGGTLEIVDAEKGAHFRACLILAGLA